MVKSRWFNYAQIKALLWKDLLIKRRQPVNFIFAFEFYHPLLYTSLLLFILFFKFLFSVVVLLQWMTAVQFLWPCIIFATVYVLRWKFSAYDVEECQFPTRELPSPHSILPFFQSYICTIENECSSPKNYSEISEFENAPYVDIMIFAYASAQFW